ncbi:fumarylacetoacetate hydrolase family protein [Nocardia sp. NPDC050718]|uniref:fumarylacetoacetate hydrolase family protein n=1 Tax=Nocardia sp. NPDC050718 TaxID=3155788 RepID=UPI0034017D3A
MSLPRIHRTLDLDARRITLHADTGAGWTATDDPPSFAVPAAFTEEYEIARYELLGVPDGARVLPVCPVSFRDFMVYEKHAVDAARGMARRFVPAGYRLGLLFEALTRRTFPPYRPHRLWNQQPLYYMSNASTMLPSGIPVTCPDYSTALDFELELGVVLGAPLRDATPAEAIAAIGAVVVINDFSARDVQLAEMRSGFGPQKSKHFATSMSATAVAGSAVADRLDALTASVRINGHTVARTGTHGMRHSLGAAIAHASRSEQLFPGELISTGTLPGGSGMELGRWLAPGDVLRLEIDEIGVIEHRIEG